VSKSELESSECKPDPAWWCMDVTVLPSGRDRVAAWPVAQGLTFNRAEASEKAMALTVR